MKVKDFFKFDWLKSKPKHASTNDVKINYADQQDQPLTDDEKEVERFKRNAGLIPPSGETMPKNPFMEQQIQHGFHELKMKMKEDIKKLKDTGFGDHITDIDDLPISRISDECKRQMIELAKADITKQQRELDLRVDLKMSKPANGVAFNGYTEGVMIPEPMTRPTTVEDLINDIKTKNDLTIDDIKKMPGATVNENCKPKTNKKPNKSKKI